MWRQRLFTTAVQKILKDAFGNKEHKNNETRRIGFMKSVHM